MNIVLYFVREHADREKRAPFVEIIRQLVQKVVIGKTPGHQDAGAIAGSLVFAA